MKLPHSILGAVAMCCSALSTHGELDLKDLPASHFSIPQYDVAHIKKLQTSIHRDPNIYLGQPDSLLLEDGKTIYVVYPHGHGARERKTPQTYMAISKDAGKTWVQKDPLPESFKDWKNAPVIHQLVDAKEKKRLILTVSYPRMRQAISEDMGETWSDYKDLFPKSMKDIPGYGGHAPPKNMIPVNDKPGHYLMMYHTTAKGSYAKKQLSRLITSSTTDGGLTWSSPRTVGTPSSKHKRARPVEPCIIRSPDGKELLALCNEFGKKYPALMMTSKDEGETWSELIEAGHDLAGQRHTPIYLPDGRIAMVFRDRSNFKESSSYGDFVLWVGTYENIRKGTPGEYRVRLLDNRGQSGDTGYAGLELLPNGQLFTVTYCTMKDGQLPEIIGLHFDLKNFDSHHNQ